MIELTFAYCHEINRIDIIVFNTYKTFYDFISKNYENGAILNIKKL